jgi:GR25 family glycosyltransferase involved in LPS biosynthesis
MFIKDIIKNVLVINLDKDTQRYEKIMKDLKKYNLDTVTTRVSGVYGKEIDEDILETYGVYNLRKNKSEAGCALSHYKTWKYMIDNYLDYSLIIEDDATLNDLMNKLDKIEIPFDVDLLYLGYHFRIYDKEKNLCSRILNEDITQINHTKINDYIYKISNVDIAIVGCYGYLLSNKGAKKLYNNYKLDNVVDEFVPSFGSSHLNSYIINPKPITHCYEFGSNIEPNYFNNSSMNLFFGNDEVHTPEETNKNEVDLTQKPQIKEDFLLNSQEKPKLTSYILFAIFLITIGLHIFLYFKHDKLNKYLLVLNIVTLLIIFISKTNLELFNIIKYNEVILPGTLFTNVLSYDPYKNIWTQQSINEVKILLQSLWDMSKEKNIKYTLIFNSLLGWKRHDKKIIPWIDSVEILVNMKDKNEITNYYNKTSNISITNLKNGSKIYLDNSKFTIKETDTNWPLIKIYYYEIDNIKDKSYIIGDNTKMYHKDLFSKYQETQLQDVMTYVIENPTSFLTQYYGLSWYQNCQSSDFDTRLNTEKQSYNNNCSFILMDDKYNEELTLLKNRIKDYDLQNHILHLYKELNLNQNKTCNIFDEKIKTTINNFLYGNTYEVPKTIHKINLTDNKISHLNMLTFFDKNKDWTYKTWNTQEIERLIFINKFSYDTNSLEIKKYIMIFEILFMYGGFYIIDDTSDISMLPMLNKIKNGMLCEIKDGKIYKIGSFKFHPIIYYILKQIQKNSYSCKEDFKENITKIINKFSNDIYYKIY